MGDTGEVKAFDGKKQTGKTEGTKGMPKEVKRSMYFMLASIFLWFTAYNAVTTAFSRYTKVVWKMEGGSFANCLMVATVAAILSYIPIGNISAKIGRKILAPGHGLLHEIGVGDVHAGHADEVAHALLQELLGELRSLSPCRSRSASRFCRRTIH